MASKSDSMTSSNCVRFHLLLSFLLVLSSPSFAQQDFECPKSYIDQGTSCYRFVVKPQLTLQEAELACLREHATLLSVQGTSENSFVVEWLKRVDVDMFNKKLKVFDGSRHEWVTSGVRKGGKFKWTSDGSTITSFHFADEAVKMEIRVDAFTDMEYRHIIYKYNGTADTYHWNWGRVMDPMSYICEISKDDLWKVYQQHRDFSFGTGLMDPTQWPVGPNITEQSGNIVFFRKTDFTMTPVSMDCFATGNPQPTYKWFLKTIGGKPLAINDNKRHTITNGRLTIQKPVIDKDVGEYYCEASNKHGIVLSNPIHLTYGKLDEFPNVVTGKYTAKLYMGVEIDCQLPTGSYKPDARFNWFKESVLRFIRPDLNPQLFLSRNGKLYISEVAASDAGQYFCAVYLAPRPGETLASGQALSRNSLPITLVVQGDNPNTYGPDIQDTFPQVFPKVPLVGEKMVLECLAYGRLPLTYKWVRTDAPINPKAYMTDQNRVLVIEKTLLQDTGNYACIVEGRTSSSNKTRYITLSGLPSFPIPLKNHFLDAGHPFSWSCLAHGVPLPTYTWYKDGKVLPANDDEMGITVRGRHLTFKSVDTIHNGIYECEAKNALGSRRSSAQLRAISFKPSFTRQPVKTSPRATAGGSITIQCLPDAAPRPTIEWTREGGSLPAGFLIHPNGALELNSLSTSDSGTYVCTATNDLGSAESAAKLMVSDTTVLTERPADDEVMINGSTSLRCKASFDSSKSDVMYHWKFYDHVINFDEDFSYAMRSTEKGFGDLYIVSAQYEHEGVYTCVVSTVTDTVKGSAYITVEGPPEAPYGVHKHKESNSNGPTSLEIWWSPGKTHRHPITKYIVEFNADDDDEWTIAPAISEEEAKINDEQFYSWRRAVISEGLSPGASYRFRVRAGSGPVGYSHPSLPSSFYKIADAAPVFPPPNVGGGGGKERELLIKWEALPKHKWGTDHIRYIVYSRRKNTDNQFDGKWERSKEEVTKTEFHKIIPSEFYYTPYEVKVQSINNFGSGPNSSVVDVMSADRMPNVAPKFSQANAINATSGTVEWQKIPNVREIIKGSILGFQVNYWLEGTQCNGGDIELTAQFTRVYGDTTSVDVIGLEPGADYCVNLQLINHAGIGPKSENNPMGMNDPAPQNYPEYVSVTSHGPESVRVTWRGVVSNFGESPLVGYQAWYWKMGEDIRSAKVVDFGKSYTGVIHGIGNTDIYKLRMMGYSAGGDGKKAPDVLFTLASQLMYNPRTTDVMNDCLINTPSVILALLMALICRVVSLN